MLCRFWSWYYAGCPNITGASSEQPRPSESGVAHHRNTESGNCTHRMGIKSALDHRQFQLSERQKGKDAHMSSSSSLFHGNLKCQKVNRKWLIFWFFFYVRPDHQQVSGKLIRKCALGTELVDWLVNISVIVHTRTQAAGMWQAILEEGVLAHGQFLLYDDGVAAHRVRIQWTFNSSVLMLFHLRAQWTRSNRSKINVFYIASKWTKMVRRVHHNRTKWMRQTNTYVKDWAHYCIVDRTQRSAWFYGNRKCGAKKWREERTFACEDKWLCRPTACGKNRK